MQVYAIILVTYFLVTGGIVYDIINEPPSIGMLKKNDIHKQKAIYQYIYRFNC